MNAKKATKHRNIANSRANNNPIVVNNANGAYWIYIISLIFLFFLFLENKSNEFYKYTL